MIVPVICLAACQCGAMATATDFPSRPIELIVPFEAGSASDVMGRLLAEMVEKEIGVKVLVNNKPGGAGATGYTYTKNCRPDGYTICMFNSTIASHKIFGNLPFDYRDMDVILLVQASPSILCVPTQSKYHKLEEIIADAKQRPEQISWAVSAGNVLMGTRDFCDQADIRLKVIPFGGGNMQPVLQASGGQVDMCFSNIIESQSPIEAGLLRPIAAYSKKRIDFLPDIPTFEELGYEVRCPVVRGVVAPPGVPKERLNIINEAFQKVVTSEQYVNFVRSSSGSSMNAAFEDSLAVLDEQRMAFQNIAARERAS